jgi:hypothetical protein
MKNLIERAQAAGLHDFQRMTADVTRKLGESYNSVIAIKEEFDKMEEVPNSAKKVNARLAKLMSLIGDAKKLAYQSEMELKRLK